MKVGLPALMGGPGLQCRWTDRKQSDAPDSTPGTLGQGYYPVHGHRHSSGNPSVQDLCFWGSRAIRDPRPDLVYVLGWDLESWGVLS